MLTSMNANSSPTHSREWTDTHGEKTQAGFTQTTATQLQIMMWFSVRDVVFPSKAAPGRVDSFYVPATFDSPAQHRPKGRNIINTPVVSSWHMLYTLGRL